MRYFDHDTQAADDDAIMALRIEYGGGAVDCYWALLEKMYRDEAPLNLFGSNGETNMETKSVSHRLCIDVETLKKYVLAMLQIGLLDGTVENVFSQRARQNIAAYQAKAESARQNGKKGGRKPTGKPKRNRVGSNAETEPEPSGLQEKKRKDIGSYIKEPISISAQDGANLSTKNRIVERCTQCGSELTRTGMQDPEFWFCNECRVFFRQAVSA